MDSDKSVTACFEEAAAGTSPDSMLSGGESGVRPKPPPAKTESVDWNLVLYIIGGGVLLAVVVLVLARVGRR
jgi:hypothetical protein